MGIDLVGLALIPFLRKGKRWKKDPVTGCAITLALLAFTAGAAMAYAILVL